MTDWTEYAKRVAVRRVVYLIVAALLAALVSMFPAKASAQVTCPSNGNCSKAQAAQACEVRKSQFSSSGYDTPRCRDVPDGGVKWFVCEAYRTNHGTWAQCGVDGKGQAYFYYNNTSCPAGQTWNSALNKCQTQCDVGSWPDPSNPGQCLDSQKCQARNDTLGTGNWVSTGEARYMCVSGCDYGFKPGESGKVQVTQGGKTSTTWSGQTYYTGQSCEWRAQQNNNVAPPDLAHEQTSEPDPNECKPIEGQTACVKPDGKMCASASNGKEFCWSPHSTGEKTSDNKMQTKKPGDQPGPASIGLPNGDTANKEGPDTTVTQTTKDGRTSTTTISNYTTASGANAGTQNNGETRNPDGTVTPGPGDGKCEGEDCEDGNDSTGGTDCDTPPQSSGDAILGMIATQTWETRCQSERMAKAHNTYAEDLQAQNDADGAVSRGDVWSGTTSEGDGINTGLVSFGGSCPPPPSISLGGETFTWPQGFCDALAMIRLLVIAAGMVAAVRIVVRS